MTKSRHGKWTAPIVLIKSGIEKPDYRSRMSAKAKRPSMIVNYQPEEVIVSPQTNENYLSLFKNIFT